MAIVNELLNPSICIPANGAPAAFHLNDGVSHPVVPSPDSRCVGGWTVGINWDGHLTATEMWAENEYGESAHIPIAVPEPDLWLYFLVAVLVGAFLSIIRRR